MKLAIAALAVASAAAAVAGEEPIVRLFIVGEMRAVHVDGRAEVYRLDGAVEALAALFRGLPPDPRAAAAEATRRLATPAGRRALARVKNSTEGAALAADLGIEKLPAVVVDGRYAVYGVADIDRALALVAAWR